MAGTRGGARPGAGRPRKHPEKAPLPKAGAAADRATTPLDFMLAVMGDPEMPIDVRMRAAQAAAPYVHAKTGEEALGKRAQIAAAADKVGGKFAVPATPKLVVNNR